MQTISSGGVDPTAAFAVISTGNGLDSLVVANNGDGNISLLSGGENGLALSSVLSSPGLPNPSGLALASFSGDSWNSTRPTMARNPRSLLGFQLEESSALAANSTSSAAAAAPLVSLNETSLALVGTLLTFTIESPSETEQSAEAAVGAATGSGPGAAGQSVAWTVRSLDEDDDMADFIASTEAMLPTAPAWARYVSGVDQAIEKVRSEADERLRQETQPARPLDPDTSLLEKDDPGRSVETSTFLEATMPGVAREAEPEHDRLAAVDRAIGSWVKAGSDVLASLSLRFLDQPVAKSTIPVLLSLDPQMRARGFAGLDTEHARPVEIVSRMATVAGISLATARARAILMRRSRLVVCPFGCDRRGLGPPAR